MKHVEIEKEMVSKQLETLTSSIQSFISLRKAASALSGADSGSDEWIDFINMESALFYQSVAIEEILEQILHPKKPDHSWDHTRCQWPGCTIAVPPKIWGCKDHWFKLPENLRKAIWEAYRKREITPPSIAYIEAVNAAQAWIAALQKPENSNEQ